MEEGAYFPNEHEPANKHVAMSNPFSNWSAQDVADWNRRVAEFRTARQHNAQQGVGEYSFTPNQTPEREPAKHESDLHDEIIAFCRSKGWYYIHSRTDRPTTNQVGCPDFCIVMDGGRIVFLEVKRPGSKPTPAQAATIAWLRKLGASAHIVHDMQEFAAAIR